MGLWRFVPYVALKQRMVPRFARHAAAARRLQQHNRSRLRLDGMTDNVAGMLAYVTIIPPILFLVIEPYNKNRFVRFHSFQNIFLHVAALVCLDRFHYHLCVLAFIPILGHLVALLLWLVLSVGFLVVWVMLLIKANQGQMWKLPVIGDMAEKQANAV